MNRSFVRMLHSSLSLLDSSAMLRSSPRAGVAHATAWFPPSPTTAAMLRRSRCSPIPLLASGVRADLSRREHLLPGAPSPPPERARASSPPVRPFHRALPPPAVPDAFGVSCPSSLRPSQDSSPPRTARRARSVSKSASTHERKSPALLLQPSRDPPDAALDIAPTRCYTFGRVGRRRPLDYQRSRIRVMSRSVRCSSPDGVNSIAMLRPDINTRSPTENGSRSSGTSSISLKYASENGFTCSTVPDFLYRTSVHTLSRSTRVTFPALRTLESFLTPEAESTA